MERYQKLGLKESLIKIHLYPLACKELSFILRFAYSKLPKNLQSLLLQDTLTAFRLLPHHHGMQTQTAVSAANILFQGAEAALPKQKRALAAAEFKQAIITHKRLSKSRQEEQGLKHLPRDILSHVFSFLDVRSLVSAALVCRSWNAASSDNNLWQLQYTVFFRSSDNHSKMKMADGGGLVQNRKHTRIQSDIFDEVGLDWRAAFKKAYKGNISKKYVTSSRGRCKQCYTIVWLTDMTSENCGLNCKKHHIEPASTQQIVEYLKGDSLSLVTSDSDSDSDEGSVSKLWAYPRQGSKLYL